MLHHIYIIAYLALCSVGAATKKLSSGQHHSNRNIHLVVEIGSELRVNSLEIEFDCLLQPTDPTKPPGNKPSYGEPKRPVIWPDVLRPSPNIEDYRGMYSTRNPLRMMSPKIQEYTLTHLYEDYYSVERELDYDKTCLEFKLTLSTSDGNVLTEHHTVCPRGKIPYKTSNTIATAIDNCYTCIDGFKQVKNKCINMTETSASYYQDGIEQCKTDHWWGRKHIFDGQPFVHEGFFRTIMNEEPNNAGLGLDQELIFLDGYIPYAKVNSWDNAPEGGLDVESYWEWANVSLSGGNWGAYDGSSSRTVEGCFKCFDGTVKVAGSNANDSPFGAARTPCPQCASFDFKALDNQDFDTRQIALTKIQNSHQLCTSTDQCGACMGVCNSDADCVGDMKCFKDVNGIIPGCGVARPSMANNLGYCYEGPLSENHGTTLVGRGTTSNRMYIESMTSHWTFDYRVDDPLEVGWGIASAHKAIAKTTCNYAQPGTANYDVLTCGAGSQIINYECVKCPKGYVYNSDLDPDQSEVLLLGRSTSRRNVIRCEVRVCAADEYAMDDDCVKCPSGTTRAAHWGPLNLVSHGHYTNATYEFKQACTCQKGQKLEIVTDPNGRPAYKHSYLGGEMHTFNLTGKWEACVTCPVGKSSPGGEEPVSLVDKFNLQFDSDPTRAGELTAIWDTEYWYGPRIAAFLSDRPTCDHVISEGTSCPASQYIKLNITSGQNACYDCPDNAYVPLNAPPLLLKDGPTTCICSSLDERYRDYASEEPGYCWDDFKPGRLIDFDGYDFGIRPSQGHGYNAIFVPGSNSNDFSTTGGSRYKPGDLAWQSIGTRNKEACTTTGTWHPDSGTCSGGSAASTDWVCPCRKAECSPKHICALDQTTINPFGNHSELVLGYPSSGICSTDHGFNGEEYWDAYGRNSGAENPYYDYIQDACKRNCENPPSVWIEKGSRINTEILNPLVADLFIGESNPNYEYKDLFADRYLVHDPHTNMCVVQGCVSEDKTKEYFSSVRDVFKHFKREELGTPNGHTYCSPSICLEPYTVTGSTAGTGSTGTSGNIWDSPMPSFCENRWECWEWDTSSPYYKHFKALRETHVSESSLRCHPDPPPGSSSAAPYCSHSCNSAEPWTCQDYTCTWGCNVNHELKSGQCVPCPLGQISNGRNDACYVGQNPEDCALGTQYYASGRCLNCEPGFYNHANVHGVGQTCVPYRCDNHGNVVVRTFPVTDGNGRCDDWAYPTTGTRDGGYSEDWDTRDKCAAQCQTHFPGTTSFYMGYSLSKVRNQCGCASASTDQTSSVCDRISEPTSDDYMWKPGYINYNAPTISAGRGSSRCKNYDFYSGNGEWSQVSYYPSDTEKQYPEHLYEGRDYYVSTHPNTAENRVKCAERCQERYPGTTTFYYLDHRGQQGCGCDSDTTSGVCDPDDTMTSYKVSDAQRYEIIPASPPITTGFSSTPGKCQDWAYAGTGNQTGGYSPTYQYKDPYLCQAQCLTHFPDTTSFYMVGRLADGSDRQCGCASATKNGVCTSTDEQSVQYTKYVFESTCQCASTHGFSDDGNSDPGQYPPCELCPVGKSSSKSSEYKCVCDPDKCNGNPGPDCTCLLYGAKQEGSKYVCQGSEQIVVDVTTSLKVCAECKDGGRCMCANGEKWDSGSVACVGCDTGDLCHCQLHQRFVYSSDDTDPDCIDYTPTTPCNDQLCKYELYAELGCYGVSNSQDQVCAQIRAEFATLTTGTCAINFDDACQELHTVQLTTDCRCGPDVSNNPSCAAGNYCWPDNYCRDVTACPLETALESDCICGYKPCNSGQYCHPRRGTDDICNDVVPLLDCAAPSPKLTTACMCGSTTCNSGQYCHPVLYSDNICNDVAPVLDCAVLPSPSQSPKLTTTCKCGGATCAAGKYCSKIGTNYVCAWEHTYQDCTDLSAVTCGSKSKNPSISCYKMWRGKYYYQISAADHNYCSCGSEICDKDELCKWDSSSSDQYCWKFDRDNQWYSYPELADSDKLTSAIIDERNSN